MIVIIFVLEFKLAIFEKEKKNGEKRLLEKQFRKNGAANLPAPPQLSAEANNQFFSSKMQPKQRLSEEKTIAGIDGSDSHIFVFTNNVHRVYT